MKALSKQLKLINPKLYIRDRREQDMVSHLKRKRALDKQLKENRRHRIEAMMFEDYSWMEMFR